MLCIKITLLAVIVSVGTALANTNIDGILVEGSHWEKGGEAASKDFPHINWESENGVWSIKGNDLRLWNRDVQSFQMTSSAKKLRLLKVGILSTDSKSAFMESLETWKAVMNVRIGKQPRESSSSSANGAVLNARWEKDSCLISLVGKEENGRYSLGLQYRLLSAPPASVAKEKDRYDGLYERSFYSPDYSKSFRGVVTDYDEETMNLKVKKGRSVISVSLDQLSDRDAEYIDKVSGLIAAQSSLAIWVKEVKEKPRKSGRTIIVDTKFDVTLANNSKTAIDDVEIRYDIFHKVDTLDGSPVLTVTSGSIDLGQFYSQYRETRATESIGIVRESRPGLSGG